MYHYAIRDKLIKKAKTCEADTYSKSYLDLPERKDEELTVEEHPRACGKDDLDITAFLATQKDWDLERDNGWVVTDDVLYKFAKLDYETPTYEVPWMYDEGRVVLDLDNHPVKDYKDIPLTCSSQIEGALMEAIRRIDFRITVIDFWARLSVHP